MPLTRQAQAFLDFIAQQNRPDWEEMAPHQGREIFSSLDGLFGDGPQLHCVEDRTLPGDIDVRVFRPTSETGQPAVMYFHGGGWVLGNTATHDPLCRRIAKGAGCTVISVDYSLSPESQFPIPLDDCYAATEHVARCPSDFGIDADRLAVVGDSAGGNLAAAVTLRARDEDGPAIKSQLLIYPVIEPKFDSGSYIQFAQDHGLSRATMQWFWEQYIGDAAPGPLAAPSTADSLGGLPPAHVITAEYDVLRDEGESYARQLSEAGVPTTIKRYDGNLHGFIHFAALFDDAMQASQDIAEVLKSQLA